MKSLLYTPFTGDVDEYLYRHIQTRLAINPSYKLLHLTPTLILRRKRQKFYATKQKHMGSSQYFPVNVNEFHAWTKEYVYQIKKETPLSKSESCVLLDRAIEHLLPNRREWRAVAGDLLSLFLYFQITDLSLADWQHFDEDADWQHLLTIYQEYCAFLAREQQEDFAQCLRRLLKDEHALAEYTEVVFDGPFLFFDAFHEAVIRTFEAQGKPVTFIVPFDQQNQGPTNPAYKIIQKTYRYYVPESEWKSIKRTHPGNSTYLEQIPSVLFADHPPIFYDGSVQLSSYSTKEQELSHVIAYLSTLIQNGRVEKQKVAIVTPNPMQMRPLVREISEQYGMEVDVPKRPLLEQTTGEFIHLLYQMRTDEKKLEKDSILTAGMFKKILASRWFPGSKQTIEAFQLIEDIFFHHPTSLSEWKRMMQRLQDAKQALAVHDYTYHPLQAVSASTLEHWLNIIDTISRLQDVLFQLQKATIKQHAQQLYTSLASLLDLSVLEQTSEGEDFLQRFLHVITTLASQNRLEITPEEFANLLPALFREEEDLPERVQEEQERRPVLVTGMENVVFQEYKYMYVIQFTQNHYPEIEKPTWPFTMDIQWRLLNQTTRISCPSVREFEKLLVDRETYYFYMTWLSTKVEYHLSFSRSDNGSPLYPSHYLHDIGKTLNIEETDAFAGGKGKHIEDLFEEYDILKKHTYSDQPGKPKLPCTPSGLPSIAATTFTLEELAVYRLCPKRFYLAQAYPNKNVYMSSFQFTAYMAAVLYQKATLYLAQDYRNQTLREVLSTYQEKGKLKNQINTYVERAMTDLSPLFPVYPEHQKGATFYATMYMENLVDAIINKQEGDALHRSGLAHADVEINDTGVTLTETLLVDNQSYTISATREITGRFHRRVSTYSLAHVQHFLNMSTYAEAKTTSTFHEWFLRMKRELFYEETKERTRAELSNLILSIKKNEVQATPGTHCTYCPFNLMCQEKKLINEHELQEEMVM